MGTNFYVRQKASRQQKDEMINAINKDDWPGLSRLIPEEVHIGKRSAGWRFLWDASYFKHFEPNKESLIKFLKSGDIYDEYGDHFTFEQFWDDEIKFFINTDELWDIEKYYAEKPREYVHYVESQIRTRFKNEWNIDVNAFGEFYIDNLRFTVYNDFS